MDDVDAVQAQIARNMLSSGDWVSARLDGVLYLEKAPLIYWLIAGAYKLFGAVDWAARLPVALSAIGLAWLTAAFGAWAFGRRAGFYAGLCIGTCVGLFLFTRILIPDVMITLTIALAIWSFLRVLDEQEKRPRLWAYTFAASIAVGLLLKSLIGAVFPIGACLFYLLFTRQLFVAATWKRIRPFAGTFIVLADCRSVACSCNVAQSALLRPDFPQRSRRVPRLLLVLLHERAGAALLEPSLSARLQHRAAPLVLAAASGLAISVERVSSRGCQTVFPSSRPRRTRAPDGSVLDRLRTRIFHVLDDAGILLHAVLSRFCTAHRFCVGHGRALDSQRHKVLGVITGAACYRRGCYRRIRVELAHSR